jgi:HSP20 family protein
LPYSKEALAMTLMRRPPNRSTVPLRTVLERLAGDWPTATDGGMADMLPALDVRETDNEYVIEVDLPGIDPEQTEVLVEGRTVTIRGRMEEDVEENRGNYLVRERRQGSFLRAVALPGMIDVDQVSTRYADGQLTIVLPKASGSRARRIAIGDGSGKRAARSDERSGNRSGSANASNGKGASGSDRSTAETSAAGAQAGSGGSRGSARAADSQSDQAKRS